MSKLSMTEFNCYYGDFHAIKDISMKVEENKVTAFIGPSGCGKSTLLKSINRMNDLVEDFRTSGQIIYENHDIYDKEIDVYNLRKKIGMVFQRPNCFPKSIYENIAYGPKTHGIKDKKSLDEIVETSLKQAAIWDEVKDKLNKSALTLSGGQAQRVCIARCLAIKPDLILLDEPTSALDPISTQKIEDLVMELKKDYTILIVTHNMQQAARISNKTCFFLLGELIEEGSTRELFSNPKKEKTEQYITGRFG